MKHVALLVANSVWFMSTIGDRLKWNRAKKEISDVQEKRLFQLLEKNKNTAFGKAHNFSKINSVLEYQKSVPIQNYQDFEPYIEAIANGEESVLTAQKVKLFEPSSGTTSGKKLIPYTDKLQAEFQNGINVWLNQLYIKYPKLFLGKMYWSISPMAEQKRTSAGIPIGFMDDAEYLGSIQKLLKKTLMVMPDEMQKIKEVKEFQYHTALYLLAEKSLSLISVWHPSFFILILDVIDEHFEQLIADIRKGKNSKRADELEAIFNEWKNKKREKQDNKGKSLYERVWNKLALISCWGDAQAEFSFESFKRLFPNTPFESKGLIATEGFVSFPNSHKEGANLSILSHFFEFKELTSNDIFLAHELQMGQQYSVIMTTAGGLYRYEIGDMVEVIEFDGLVPLIKFMGKKDYIVDMCGEKLSEIEVDRAVKKVLNHFELMADFWMVAPEKVDEHTFHYTLFIQIDFMENSNLICVEIDKLLRENFHYNYCRDLGQLGELKLFLIDKDDEPIKKYFDIAHKEGQQLGDIKPKALHRGCDWADVFKGTISIS